MHVKITSQSSWTGLHPRQPEERLVYKEMGDVPSEVRSSGS